MHLPDVNFWLAIAFEAHAHHRRAAAWFGTAPDDSVAFCRFTQQGFLRIATNPSAFGDEALDLGGAWSAYDALANDPRIRYLPEPAGIETPWREATKRRRYSHRIWSDAYLAAFADAAGAAIVSFDGGFGGYRNVRWVRP